MLKIRIDKATTEIEAVGTAPDITAELLMGIKVLKEKFDRNGVGDAFMDALKAGLEIVELSEEDADAHMDEVLDKALEDEDFLDFLMDNVPDELESALAKKLLKRTNEKK